VVDRVDCVKPKTIPLVLFVSLLTCCDHDLRVTCIYDVKDCQDRNSRDKRWNV